MAHPGRTLLACWLAVVLSGTVVQHRHAADPGHTHEIGWASFGAERGADLSPAHRHLVLLGIEFGAVPTPADAGSIDSAGPAAGEGVADGTGDDRRAEPAADFPVSQTLAALPVAPRGRPAALAAPSRDSAHLSRARTGVLRS